MKRIIQICSLFICLSILLTSCKDKKILIGNSSGNNTSNDSFNYTSNGENMNNSQMIIESVNTSNPAINSNTIYTSNTTVISQSENNLASNHTSSGLTSSSKPAFDEFSIKDNKKTPNAPEILSVKASDSSVAKYEIVEFTIVFKANYSNPFNTNEIALDAEFTTPSGKKLTVPGFVTKKIDKSSAMSWGGDSYKNGNLTKQEEIWEVRFSYSEVGNYTVKFRIIDKNGRFVHTGTRLNITATSDTKLQPVEITENKNYFRYKETKQKFIPVGYQLPWSWPMTYDNYESNVNYLAQNGGNFTRIWGGGIAQTMAIENLNYGLGRYQLNNAEAQDYIFDMFRKKGVRVQYAFDSYNSFHSSEQFYGEWKNSPYNKANGGIVQKPIDYFKDAQAIAYTKQKIRYCVARWGWDSNIVFWEIMNEIDGCDDFYTNKDVYKEWIDQIATYIKECDYYKRPVSISYANPEGHPSINFLESIDFVTVHFYHQVDMASAMKRFIKSSSGYGKPVVIGEFGPDSGDFDKCKNGLNLHEGIWSSIANGAANVAQYWWWDELINPNQLYKEFKPISNFIQSFDFAKENLVSLTGSTSNNYVRIEGRINNTNTRGFAWVQNTQNTWRSVATGGMKADLKNITTNVDVSNGTYKVTIWNTRTGSTEQKTIIVTNKKLQVTIPLLSLDTAYSFIKQ